MLDARLTVGAWVGAFYPCVKWNNRSQTHSICNLHFETIATPSSQMNKGQLSVFSESLYYMQMARQIRKSNVGMVWCWLQRKWMTVEKHNANANLKAIKQPRLFQAMVPILMIISYEKKLPKGRCLCRK